VIRIDGAGDGDRGVYLLGRGALALLGEETARAAPPASRGGRGSGVCALVSDLGIAGTPHLEAAEASLRAAGLSPAVHLLPAGESAKSLTEAERLWQFLAESRLERRDPVVALGGGAVGDVAGFCAAIDLAEGKNLVGAVHAPELVLADLDVLATLPSAELRAGFAEVVKCALLMPQERDRRDALADLASRAPAAVAADAEACAAAVDLAVRVKVEHVRGDPEDLTGRRSLLNLGHTVGHALESVVGLGTIRHGEAVAVGTVIAVRIATHRGDVPGDLLAATIGTLAAFGLPTALPAGVRASDLVAATGRDKKRAGGRRRMVLPLAAGGAALSDVPDAELLAALRASGG
jgi:3-dehydroquinate synthetase